MAAGLLAFSSRQFALTIKHGLFFFRFTLFFLPKQTSRAAYAARGAKRLVSRTALLILPAMESGFARVLQ